MGRPGTWRKGQSGNPQGRPPKDKAFTEALRARLDPAELAERMVQLIEEGNFEAMKYCYNRLEGTPEQAVALKGDAERPIHVRLPDRPSATD